MVSGLLLVLEPGPIMPLGAVRLSSLDEPGAAQQSIFQTRPSIQRDRWPAILIRFSGSKQGSARELHESHEREGRGGLGVHFVIGSGHGSPDGRLETGYRWKSQLPGAHTTGPDADWFNEHAISICLIGDANRWPPTEAQVRSLVNLVQQLQARLAIPSDHVLVEAGPEVRGLVPRLFPVARFRQQLLSAPAP